MNNTATWLVTGGAGFIGVNFVKMLLAEKLGRVVVLDALTYAGNIRSLESEIGSGAIEFVKGDIGDDQLVAGLLARIRPAYIVNFAAESHVDRSVDNPRPFVEANVLGTQNLLECARQYVKNGGDLRKFVQIGTDEVYGDLDMDFDEPQILDGVDALIGREVRVFGRETFSEHSPLKPSSPYSASKAAADMMALAYHRTFGLPVVVTRCSNNYGPYQFPEKLIPLMINNIMEGRSLPIYGKGLNVRDWIYVDDHCSGVIAAALNGRAGEVYNFGGYYEARNIDLVNMLIDLVRESEGIDGSSLVTYVSDRPGHDRRYAMDASKSIRELGWKPEVLLEDGMKRTVRWYLDNRDWVTEIVEGDYRSYYEKMYSNR